MKAVGIILAGGNSERMQELSSRRAIAAMPLAGTYRGVDFALSNMANSNVNTVAVITQYSSRSLNEHLSSPSWWGFGRKQGGLFLLNPTITPNNSSWYRGTADALIQNLDFLKERHEPYVIIANGDGVYKIDLNAVMDFHMASGSEFTVVCKEMPNAESERFGVLELDAEQRIVGWHEKNEKAEGSFVNCGIYVVRRRYLITLLEECQRKELYNLVQDVLVKRLERGRFMGYVHEGYWNSINSVKSFFDTNMELLKPELRKEFFYDFPVIHTKVDDYPPAKLNEEASVKNSLTAGGSIINGRVEDSVLFKKVFVGDGSRVRHCILLNDVYVGEKCRLEYCIVEEKTKIEAGTEIIGSPDHIRIIS